MSKVTVIIPTYNEEATIERCLESLFAQNYKDFEIILVDDGSTDNTVEIIKSITPIQSVQISCLHQEHLGPGAARNLAAKQAKGDILVFVDADMTFDKNFLRMLIKPISSGKVQGTFSKYEYVANWDNVWARCWNINEGWEPKRRHPKNYSDKQPVFRAILKSEFDRVDGFTPGGYNDDWSLAKKLGYEADSAPGAVFYHQNPGSLHEIFFHAKWVGKRPYKLGIIGALIALLRSFFLISIVVGLVKAIFYKTPPFLLFKLLYDAGLSMGIVSMLISHKMAK
jgi:glycosyltransferase involved in cell wall biosynthesis